MGTRASFWIGNPEDLSNRIWLGCIANDGYPDGWPKKILDAQTLSDFVYGVEQIAEQDVEGFTDPEKHGWPFPWDDNIFLTDYTYAWFDGKLNIACFHAGWFDPQTIDNCGEEEDNLPETVPAPKKFDRSAPDSIIIMRMPK